MVAGALSHRPLRRASPRAQVSIEYLIILGFTLLLLLPLIYLFYTQQSSFESEVASSQADKAAQKIADAADAVYYLGEPSQQTLTLNYPTNIINITVGSGSISFLISDEGTDYEVVKWTAANLSGNLSPTQGIHHVTLVAKGGKVIVSG